jgi:hypothetical protein
MKIKSISLLLLLITLSACASNATKSNEPIQLMDGSNLFIDKGKAVKITDKTGETVSIKKGGMLELANGDYIYIQRDGSVKKMGGSKSSHGHNSKSSSGHSH